MDFPFLGMLPSLVHPRFKNSFRRMFFLQNSDSAFEIGTLSVIENVISLSKEKFLKLPFVTTEKNCFRGNHILEKPTHRLVCPYGLAPHRTAEKSFHNFRRLCDKTATAHKHKHSMHHSVDFFLLKRVRQNH